MRTMKVDMCDLSNYIHFMLEALRTGSKYL